MFAVRTFVNKLAGGFEHLARLPARGISTIGMLPLEKMTKKRPISFESYLKLAKNQIDTGRIDGGNGIPKEKSS